MHKHIYILDYSTPNTQHDEIEIEATSRQESADKLREIYPSAYIHRIQKRIGECAVSSAD